MICQPYKAKSDRTCDRMYCIGAVKISSAFRARTRARNTTPRANKNVSRGRCTIQHEDTENCIKKTVGVRDETTPANAGGSGGGVLACGKILGIIHSGRATTSESYVDRYKSVPLDIMCFSFTRISM